MKNTAIEWADNTSNFFIGCTKVSEGCANCYMYRLEKRWGRDPSIVRETNWNTRAQELKKWKPSTIFLNSMSDTFHESITDKKIISMFRIINMIGSHHTYLVLTKRIERAKKFFDKYGLLPDNFWIGTSIENNKQRKRLEWLGQIKSKIRFVSFEPLLDFINIKPINCFEWAIIGGESGYKPRLPKQEMINDLISQLKEMEIPIFYKQFGGSKKCKCHNAWGCRLWNGQTLDEMPVIKV
jgi:protein gp37